MTDHHYTLIKKHTESHRATRFVVIFVSSLLTGVLGGATLAAFISAFHPLPLREGVVFCMVPLMWISAVLYGTYSRPKEELVETTEDVTLRPRKKEVTP